MKQKFMQENAQTKITIRILHLLAEPSNEGGCGALHLNQVRVPFYEVRTTQSLLAKQVLQM